MPKKKTAVRAAASASPAVKAAAGAEEPQQELKRAPNTPAMMLMSPACVPTMPSSPAVPNMNEGDQPESMSAAAGGWEPGYQTLTRKSPRPRPHGEATMQGLSSAQLADDVDTGVRMSESAGSDPVLLEMPRGSPAEICMRISPGDRVLGVESPKDPKVGDIMRLVVHGAKGPTTAEIIYTASALVQKSQDAFEALDAVSAHARANGGGTGLILCTTLEQQVRGVLRKQYAIQEELRRDWEADSRKLRRDWEADSATRTDEPARVAALEKSVDAMRRQLKAQEAVIENYKQSLALYEKKSPDKSTETPQQGQKSTDQLSKNTQALILAQEKEILALQRELDAKSKVQQEMLNTWASPERLLQLEAEVARLRDVEMEVLAVKADREAMFRRTLSLDKESGALRHMVQALGTELLEVKKGMLNGIPIDLSTGGPLPANQYDKATDKVRKTLLEDIGVPTDVAHRLQVALAERDDLAAQMRELQAFVKESTEQASQDFKSIASRDKVITDLREQLTKFQELYDETVTEMQSELQKSVEEGAEIKQKLVQTHEMAMKELRKYASDLEARASADRRFIELENKAHLEEERTANKALREQLHKSEQQIRTMRKDREEYEKEVCDKTERTKEELLEIAGKSARQRVQIIELEELLHEAREEIKMLHAIIQTTADEANTRITSEVDQLQRSVAERESKYVSGMRDLSQALHETRDQLVEQLSQKKELSEQFSNQIQELKQELQLKHAAVQKLTVEGDTLSQKLRLLEDDAIVVRDRCEKLARENNELKETLAQLRSQLKTAVEEELRLNELTKRLDKENAKAQIDLQAAIDTLDSHKKKDSKRKDDILQQQKHNEELLELLQTQQGSLVQNAKDMAEYEKTIVQMAAELDQYRKTDLHTTPAYMEPDGSSTSPIKLDTAKLTRAAASPPQHAAGSSSTSPLYRQVSVESAKELELASLGLSLKLEGGRVFVHSCLDGGPASQSLVVDNGDELLSIDGKDLDGLSEQQIRCMVQNCEDNQTHVTLFLVKKDMPSRRCRVALRIGIAKSGATPDTSPKP